MSASANLRRLLDEPNLTRVPGVYDGISARLASAARFDALYLTGAGTSMSLIGQPDIGLLGLEEVASQVRRIASVTELPIIADGDTGFGNHLNTARAVRDFERAGAAAIQLEDQISPKRCGHLDHKYVIPVEDFVLKLKAAIRAREDPDFVIVARTDARASEGIDSAIYRANRYREIGADVIFVEAPQSMAEVELIATRIDAPLLFNVVAGGKTPEVPLSTIEALGYRIAIFPGTALISAIHAIESAFVDLASDTGYVAPHGSSPLDLFSRFGLGEWKQFERDLLKIDGEGGDGD